MRRGAGNGCCGFKAGDLGAEDELLRGADGFDGGEELLPDGGELAGEVEHGDGLEDSGGGGLRCVQRHIGNGISVWEKKIAWAEWERKSF